MYVFFLRSSFILRLKQRTFPVDLKITFQKICSHSQIISKVGFYRSNNMLAFSAVNFQEIEMRQRAVNIIK